MNKLRTFYRKIQLTLIFSVIVFFIMFVTMMISLSVMFILQHLGLLEYKIFDGSPMIYFVVISLALGTVFSLVFSKRPLSHIRKITHATEKIADGDYSIRLNLKGADELIRLSNSFNHMAEELASVEILKTGFVNDFSHEFKTPIVSIRGFAKMLKREDLSVEEREEYLDIIISESERLADLSSNVLLLSKLEQQAILSEKTIFNLSEQIRLCAALLDTKWKEKDIDYHFECGEVEVFGNEELLRQVWINLLDNSLKFSEEKGVLKIEITDVENECHVTITDYGIGMDGQTMSHIFDKFYQSDSSHHTSGNGLGLSIAKRIVELHHGAIHVSSTYGVGTAFEVALPKCMKNI